MQQDICIKGGRGPVAIPYAAFDSMEDKLNQGQPHYNHTIGSKLIQPFTKQPCHSNTD